MDIWGKIYGFKALLHSIHQIKLKKNKIEENEGIYAILNVRMVNILYT